MKQFKVTFKPAYDDCKGMKLPQNLIDILKKPKVVFYDQTEMYIINDLLKSGNVNKIEIL